VNPLDGDVVCVEKVWPVSDVSLLIQVLNESQESEIRSQARESCFESNPCQVLLEFSP
jgi:hypothetical protein